MHQVVRYFVRLADCDLGKGRRRTPNDACNMQRVLQLDPRDNVLIALNDLKQGDQIEFRGAKYSLVCSVPAKHKLATADLPLGADVIMYGVLVGKTFQPVKKGELLTLANLRHESAECAAGKRTRAPCRR